MAIAAAPSVTNSSNPLPPSSMPPASLVISSNTHSYPIVGILGEGGGGRVWEVLTPRGVNHLAVKILHQERRSRELAEREIESLQKVQGIPHVLKYIGHFPVHHMHYKDANLSLDHKPEDPAQIAILTERVQCPDCFNMFLEERTQDSNGTSKLRFASIMDIGKQALETLQCMHARGCIHDGIKPENMSYDPLAKKFTMLDFGSVIEKGLDDQAGTEETRAWRPPECILSTTYNETSDIWSLGISLFSLYTGEALIPIQEQPGRQPIIDYLHLLFFNMGKELNPALIQLAPDRIRSLFTQRSDGSFAIRFPLSEYGQQCLRWQEQSKIRKGRQLLGGDCREMKVWQARIYEAAILKGDSPSQALALIDFIGPMLRTETRSENVDENRVTASAALQRLNTLLPDLNSSPEAPVSEHKN